MSDSLWPHGRQHTRLPCPSPTPGVYSNPCPLSQWCHPTISSSVVPFFSCLQSFPALGSFPTNQFFTSGGHSIGFSGSTSVLPMNIQGWFPLGLTGLISLLSKWLSSLLQHHSSKASILQCSDHIQSEFFKLNMNIYCFYAWIITIFVRAHFLIPLFLINMLVVEIVQLGRIFLSPFLYSLICFLKSM